MTVNWYRVSAQNPKARRAMVITLCRFQTSQHAPQSSRQLYGVSLRDNGVPAIGLDEEGFDYWVGSLNHVDPTKRETDYEVLLGFSESPENCRLFTDMTGFG